MLSTTEFGLQVDDVHRIGLVFGDIHKRLGLIYRHFVGLALHRDAGFDGERVRAGLSIVRRTSDYPADDIDLSIAQAGDIGGVWRRGRSVSGHNNPKRIFASGQAVAGAQIEFGALHVSVSLQRAFRRAGYRPLVKLLDPALQASSEDCDRVVIVVRHDQHIAIA